MQSYAYVIVNVFAQSHFGGNPLAVFPEADGLSQEAMQLIARQFNLSETVFVKPATEQSAVKKLRIFTPEYELPFAGHPTLGAAAVLRQGLDLPEQYSLETQAGLVDIVHQNDQVTFGLRNPVHITPSAISPAHMAEILGLVPENIVGDVVNVNTGTAQTLVQLDSAQARENLPDCDCTVLTALCSPKPLRLARKPREGHLRAYFSGNKAPCWKTLAQARRRPISAAGQSTTSERHWRGKSPKVM